jgi:uncharacterized membrane protein YedE/YeeE
MMFEYWPWWLGGLALAALTILFRLSTSRVLGVSGSWYRVAFWRQHQEQDKAAAALTHHEDAAADAMMAAALAEFGDDALEEALGKSVENPSSSDSDKRSSTKFIPTPWTVHLVFLLSTFAGAFLWGIYTGNFHIQFELSEFHTQLSGPGWKTLFTLFAGGLFVGIGTQMAGGCSSGHGLSGCSNFSVGSVIATVCFFGTAVLVSMSLTLVGL